jgi:hypothetical protein
MRRLKQVEDEDTKLRKVVADQHRRQAVAAAPMKKTLTRQLRLFDCEEVARRAIRSFLVYISCDSSNCFLLAASYESGSARQLNCDPDSSLRSSTIGCRVALPTFNQAFYAELLV